MRPALESFGGKVAARARIALLVLVAAALVAAASASARVDRSAVPLSAVPVSAQVALDWNANAVAAVRAATTTDGLPPGAPPRALFQTEGLIVLAYAQAAVYDAVTKVAHRYEPYHHFSLAAGNASVEAATMAAAYNALTFYLGDPGGVLAGKYEASIAALPDNATTARGIAVGRAAAADIEALRATDGRDAATAVYGAIGPVVAGVWQVVPPATFAQTPWVAFMQPFMLESPSQFQAPPPPALTSAQYATDFNETKLYGSATSALRTVGPLPSQTAIALFWNANVISQQNQLYRDVATQHRMDLVDTVRLLAMGDMTASDAGIACFDSKYHYLHWRPFTAIRNADLDGNPATTADQTWMPLIPTPNHPEYPSAHGCVTSAVTRVIAEALGTSNIDITIMGAAGGATALTTSQHFDTVQQVQDQVVDARTWAGLHWRNSSVAGENLGNAVADWVLQRYFLPLGADRGRGNSQSDNSQDGNSQSGNSQSGNSQSDNSSSDDTQSQSQSQSQSNGQDQGQGHGRREGQDQSQSQAHGRGQ
jgi:hypothetical protein